MTLELREATIRLAGYVLHPLKFGFDFPRPFDLAPKALPIVQTPTHGSWPSGHATEASATATILEGLERLRTTRLV
jgi:membrane-associated phospholipid phosphatase